MSYDFFGGSFPGTSTAQVKRLDNICGRSTKMFERVPQISLSYMPFKGYKGRLCKFTQASFVTRNFTLEYIHAAT